MQSFILIFLSDNLSYLVLTKWHMIDVHSPPEDNLNTSNKDIINIPD